MSSVSRLLFGKPRDLRDPRLHHRLSLVAFLAWVGLGADGLSSSAYGPEEAFKALGQHTYLAVALAALMAITVLLISAAYRRIIEEFPSGGGGYVVASKLLGPTAGVVSGSALLVDYVLTITISIAAAGDALFSFLPPAWHGSSCRWRSRSSCCLTTLNIRGVRESVHGAAPGLPAVPGHARCAHRRRHRGASAGAARDCRGRSGADSSRVSRPSASAACCSSSSGPTRSAAGPTPASRRSPTACRSCGSPRSRPGSAPWCTWGHRSPSPPRGCCSAICSGGSRRSPGRP